MDMIDHTPSMALVPLMMVLQGIAAFFGLVAGVLFALATALMVILVVPMAALVALFVGPKKDKGRQGWRPVPA